MLTTAWGKPELGVLFYLSADDSFSQLHEQWSWKLYNDFLMPVVD